MYVALLGPGPICGKDRRDNACIRCRGVQKDEEWGQRWCVVVLGASMGPGVPKGFRLCPLLLPPSPMAGITAPTLIAALPWCEFQITLGLPAHLAWPLTACFAAPLHRGTSLQFHLQRRSQISTRNTRGGYMCGLLALYGQSEGSHTFYAKRLAIRTCTPLVRHDSPFQLVARFQPLALIGQTTHRPFGSNRTASRRTVHPGSPSDELP